MARTPEFEDMSQHDWPADLRDLREAAALVYSAYAALDETRMPLLMAPSPYFKAEYTELTGAAWALLKAIRAVGLARLAEEEAQAGV